MAAQHEACAARDSVTAITWSERRGGVDEEAQTDPLTLELTKFRLT